jgi:hypothetical protein
MPVKQRGLIGYDRAPSFNTEVTEAPEDAQRIFKDQDNNTRNKTSSVPSSGASVTSVLKLGALS